MPAPALPLIGRPPHRFRVDHGWARLPDHLRWGNTHAAACDGRDRVYIAHTSRPDSPCRDTVIVFDLDGNYIRSWGERFFGHAHGLVHRVEDGRELLYLVHDREGIFRCTLDGEILFHFPKPACYDEQGLKFGPANLAFAPDGTLYMVEGYGSSFVLHLNPDGRLLNRFGGWGDEPRHTRWAHGVLVAEHDGRPMVHVATDEPSAIKRFELDGTYHSDLPGEWRHPRNMIPSADGLLWAIPEMQGRLTLLDRARGETYRLGDWGRSMADIFKLRTGPSSGFPPGVFASAHGAAFVPGGGLIVTEWVEHGRVSRLYPDPD